MSSSASSSLSSQSDQYLSLAQPSDEKPSNPEQSPTSSSSASRSSTSRSSTSSPLISLIPMVTGLTPVHILSDNPRNLVVSAQDPKTRDMFAVKVGRTDSLKSEYEALSQLEHPNIVHLIQVFEFGEFVFLILEWGPEQSLAHHILQRGHFDLQVATIILEQMVSVIKYLHRAGWVHRDLKPDNFLFDPSTNHLILIDFEFCSRWSETKFLKENVGTLEYAAPELRLGKYYRGPEVDLWSFGVCLFVILLGEFPFSHKQLTHCSEELILPESLRTHLVWSRLLCGLMDKRVHKRWRLKEVERCLFRLKVSDSLSRTSEISPVSKKKKFLELLFSKSINSKEKE